MPSESKDNLQAEIVVIGGGGAGLAAAITASENGAKKIIVLESRKVTGGNSALAMGPFTIGKPGQKLEDLESEVEDYFQKSMNYTHWKTCPLITRKLIEKAGDLVPWMEAMGVTFEFDDSIPGPPPYRIVGSGRGGLVLTRAMAQKCEDLGVEIRLQARARQLILDKSGRLSGVEVEEDGGMTTINTGNVIIATGGFAGNVKMLKEYFVDFRDDAIPLRGLAHKGDGILMAKEVGAGTDGLAFPELSMFLNLKSDFMTLLSSSSDRLWVNRGGERFADESIARPEAANAIYRQPGKVYYSIFDEEAKKSFLENPRNAPLADQIEKDLQTCIEDGRAMIADSLDEIAQWLEIPSDTLQKTVNDYNACCDKGHDIFLKDKQFLLPVGTPPFYGMKCGVSLLVTHGDLKVDYNMMVMDKEDNLIQGLYAVGDDTCGVDSDTYNLNLPGHSLGFAINSGRIAGEHAARSLKR